ncbi:MAG: UDP-N-acetylmuramate dehydrogenase [Clostridia bacterium]|nr:UDP-N-acetylmuramate dehydrogenase [Clostridia bacterium]
MKFERLLFDIDGVKVNKDVSFGSITTMGVGGKAAYVVQPCCTEALEKVMRLCDAQGVRRKAFGAGSNIIAPDNGYEGVIILFGRFMSNIEGDKSRVVCQSGAKLSMLAKYSEVYSLGGGEFLSCIPGTVGGGTVSNAGCFGGECSQIIRRVFLTDGNRRTDMTAEELGFGYRSCDLPEGYVIYAVEYRFERAYYDVGERIRRMKEVKAKTQPVNTRCAGSVFKRTGEYIPAKRIDELGLKGLCVNGAAVSYRHAGFIVNDGTATQKDIVELIELIREEVRKQDGRELTLEVELLG